MLLRRRLRSISVSIAFYHEGAGAVQTVGMAFDVVAGCLAGAQGGHEFALDARDVGVKDCLRLRAETLQGVITALTFVKDGLVLI